MSRRTGPVVVVVPSCPCSSSPCSWSPCAWSPCACAFPMAPSRVRWRTAGRPSCVCSAPRSRPARRSGGQVRKGRVAVRRPPPRRTASRLGREAGGERDHRERVEPQQADAGLRRAWRSRGGRRRARPRRWTARPHTPTSPRATAGAGRRDQPGSIDSTAVGQHRAAARTSWRPSRRDACTQRRCRDTGAGFGVERDAARRALARARRGSGRASRSPPRARRR